MQRESYEEWLASLARKREPAMAEARRLVESERYDEAERAVTAVDDSIYGAVALARMYRERLAGLVASGALKAREDRARAERVFARALLWAHSAYPEPHTAIEAEDYQRGREENLADLVGLLGYDPRGGAKR